MWINKWNNWSINLRTIGLQFVNSRMLMSINVILYTQNIKLIDIQKIQNIDENFKWKFTTIKSTFFCSFTPPKLQTTPQTIFIFKLTSQRCEKGFCHFILFISLVVPVKIWKKRGVNGKIERKYISSVVPLLNSTFSWTKFQFFFTNILIWKMKCLTK